MLKVLYPHLTKVKDFPPMHEFMAHPTVINISRPIGYAPVKVENGEAKIVSCHWYECKESLASFGWKAHMRKHSNPAMCRGVLSELPDADKVIIGSVMYSGDRLWKNISSYVDKWNDKLGYAPLLRLEIDNPNLLLIQFDPEWAKTPQMYHLFILLMRLGIVYENGIDPIEHLKLVKDLKVNAIHPTDRKHLISAYDRIVTVWNNANGDHFLERWESFPTENGVCGLIFGRSTIPLNINWHDV